MSGVSIERDPNIVFTPEYWGEAIAFSEDVADDFPFPSARNSRQASQALSPVIDKIISGELTGHTMAKGVVYDPLDEDLARTSVYNMPGSVLVADIERVRPIASERDPEPRRTMTTDPEHVFSSPRGLLQTRTKLSEEGRLYGAGRAELKFNNGELVYRRVAAVVINATAKRLLVPFTPFGAVNIATPSGHQETSVGSTYPALELEGVHVVDQTYFLPRNPAERTRLRSLELCAAGEQVRAESPSFASRFLGRFAAHHS